MVVHIALSKAAITVDARAGSYHADKDLKQRPLGIVVRFFKPA